MTTAALAGRRIRITGTVQGVGFRPWVYRAATSAGVTGRVRNDASGVTIDAFGGEAALARFITALGTPPPAATIQRFEVADIAHEHAASFDIVASERGREPRVSIPPDLAVCGECVAEIFDRSNRRYRYAFTNCTNCGPRFTIATDIPYDRATTTMARFGMCPACRREYKDVADRRFHAQPNACPICGPQLTLRAADGTRIPTDDVIAAAAKALVEGEIVAIKGLGGFHLACDATSDAAVRELRRRKRRDEKPLAVMVAHLDAAATVAFVDSVAEELLTSPERPIVLLPRLDESAIADSVAPGNRMLGLMLPYSPLHHLLLADAKRPLVMTSANLSDEPIVVKNDEAVERLGRIADLFVEHDRDIASRADDSVVAVIGGAGSVVRRSRGFVPRGVEVGRGFARPVLACGAVLKNTFCLAAGTTAWLGPHIGDLEHLAAFDAYVAAIVRMERFLQIRPEVIAHDLHPDYVSTTYANARPEAVKIAVQHHHAHVVSAMAEHGLAGPVIGIAYDGAGYGTDGTIWGGEVLVATADAFRRVATFRPLRLVGGDTAVRSPWRLAVALVDDAFDGFVPASVRSRFPRVRTEEVEAVRGMLRGRTPLPLARGVGRYFDAFGALFLGRSRASFEGQVALEWNQAADPAVTRAYPFDVGVGVNGCRTAEDTWVLEIDLRPAVRAAVADYGDQVDIGTIAAAFHNTIAAATFAVVHRAIADAGAMPIVASGGCFQNALLADRVQAALSPEHAVLFQRAVPPGDGGIALGQAVVANAVAHS
jgi:hydrogenase maturation protein HypF